MKLTSSGAITWEKKYGGTGQDYAHSVQQTRDGGYIVAGHTTSFSAGDYDLWVLKLDSNGGVTWQKTYGGSNDDYTYSIRQTQDEGYIVAGHTFSFGVGMTTLPLLQRLMASPAPARRVIRALVITPTRELAAQVQESIRTYGKHLPLRSTVVFGGVGIHPQIAELRRGVDILVATPGRLLDHAQQRTVDLRYVETLVLDEADRMLDMGFIPDVRRILKLLPAKRQNLLFSATFPDQIRELASTFLKNAATVEVARRNTPAELVAQVAHPVDSGRKCWPRRC